VEDVWSLYGRGWSPQCKLVIQAPLSTLSMLFGSQEIIYGESIAAKIIH